MFPIDRIHELAKEGFIRACAPVHAGFMGGGGNQEKFKHENWSGPSHRCLKKRMSTQSSSQLDEVPATALQYWCRERLKRAGIPTIIIAALPPVVRQAGTPRAVAPLVPMGAKCRRTEQRRNADRDCKSNSGAARCNRYSRKGNSASI